MIMTNVTMIILGLLIGVAAFTLFFRLGYITFIKKQKHSGFEGYSEYSGTTGIERVANSGYASGYASINPFYSSLTTTTTYVDEPPEDPNETDPVDIEDPNETDPVDMIPDGPSLYLNTALDGAANPPVKPHSRYDLIKKENRDG